MAETEPAETLAALARASLERPLDMDVLTGGWWPCCCGDWHPAESVCPVGGWIT